MKVEIKQPEEEKITFDTGATEFKKPEPIVYTDYTPKDTVFIGLDFLLHDF